MSIKLILTKLNIWHILWKDVKITKIAKHLIYLKTSTIQYNSNNTIKEQEKKIQKINKFVRKDFS